MTGLNSIPLDLEVFLFDQLNNRVAYRVSGDDKDIWS